MARAAVVAVRCDDGQGRDTLQRFSQKAQPFGTIAVVVCEQDLQARCPFPAARGGRGALYCKPRRDGAWTEAAAIKDEDRALFRAAV
ncbi:MAG TPA: hypothetical protein VFR77_05115, partial [Steroidobacteraceae bacterium]|nr:hypothetical protein [Steroidobacteraceae bacterium]